MPQLWSVLALTSVRISGELPVSSKYCHSCGFALVDNARICTACGTLKEPSAIEPTGHPTKPSAHLLIIATCILVLVIATFVTMFLIQDTVSPTTQNMPNALVGGAQTCPQASVIPTWNFRNHEPCIVVDL